MTFRVLHVIGGSEFGGIIPYVASLVRMAREHGGDGAVLATAPRVTEYYHERGIEVIQLAGIERPINPFRDTVDLFRLFRYLNDHEFDVVHTHTSKGGLIGRLAATLARVPIVIHTTQGYAFSDYAKTGPTQFTFLTLERMATRWCDYIVAVNEADRMNAIQHGVVHPSRIRSIPNGIDLRIAHDALSLGPIKHGELGLDPDRPVVGAMGRLAPQKGLEYFIDCIPAVRDEMPGAQFVIAGSGESEASLKERARAKGIPITFAGFRSETFRLLQTFDVFVMPSLWEGMPMMLLEAMAASRPIVCTRIKGILDVCLDADVAILVEPRQPAELSRSIIDLLRDRKKRHELGRRARAHLEAYFSDAVMTSRTWQVYEAIASEKRVVLR